MSEQCCAPPSKPAVDSSYRRVLWLALAANAAMFVVEIVAGLIAGSSALLSDSLDFLGDAANYAISLMALGLGARWRAGAALFKGASMGAFGLWVVFWVIRSALWPSVPSAPIMGAVGTLALAVNLSVAVLLYRWREGDANMRSVWLCTRNDALGNVAVLVAAGGVLASGAGWPDLVVAIGIAALALSGAAQVIRQSLAEFGATRLAAGE